MRQLSRRSFVRSAAVLVLALLAAAPVAQAQDQSLVVYSGRNKGFTERLLKQFTETTGIQVQVRQGPDSQLLATLQEEGAASPADVYWANSTGGLAAATNDGLLTPLPQELLSKPARFVPEGGQWVPVTTRFRVLAYNPEKVKEADLPKSVMDLPKLEQFKGRIGWTPTYPAFPDFVTAMRVQEGEAAAKSWLEAMQKLEPKAYPSNPPMLEAMQAGEIDLALTNHYYVYRILANAKAEGTEPKVAIYHFEKGDVGNLALVTGAAVLKTSKKPELAQKFVEYLLSPEAQALAAETARDYPLITGTKLPEIMVPIDEVLPLSPDTDFDKLRDLDATQKLLREVGVQ